MRQKTLSLLLIFVFVSGASAQKKRAPDAGMPDASRLRAHVTYLASDKLDGRRTGTDGAKAAASYIAAQFARLGLKSGTGGKAAAKNAKAGGQQPFMQSFPYVAGVELGKTNAMSLLRRAPAIEGEPVGGGITTLDMRLGEDWTPLGFSSNARLYTLPVTFVGYGITAADLKYDDYAGMEVKDRISIALAGTPDGDNPHGEFARYFDVRWKSIAARDHGAKALVIVAGADNFRDDRLTRLTYDNSAGDAGLPVIVISRQAASQILGLSGITQLAELEKRVAASAAQAKKDAAPPTLSPVLDAVNKASFMEQSRLTLATDIVRREAPATNVIGILEGSDAKLKNEAIIIGAHYDHLGRGGSGSLATREGEVHYGADDNASGVAGMLELARLFAAGRGKIKRTIIFIAFGGEEEGLIGSNFYVNQPVVPLADTVAMINMDMIGRLKDDKLVVGGVGTAQEWRSLIESANQTFSPLGHSVAMRPPMRKILTLTLNEDGYGPSDHSSFYAKKVPVLFFWTGTHADYHKPSDTADKINYEGEARILSMIKSIVQAVDGNDRRPAYTVAKSESTGRTNMGFKVSLGTIPNYAESNGGLLLDGVRDDSPAAKAGLKAGDKVVRLAGREIRNIEDYTYTLGEMKAGEEYEVEVMRGSEVVKLKIIPAARK